MRSSSFSQKAKRIPETSRLMMQACLTNVAERRKELVRQWEELIIMDDMPYSEMRLVPLFLYGNQQAGISTTYDNRLKTIYKHWWLKTQHILSQLKMVHAVFFDADIAMVVIKGASIMDCYERPELRPMADFDLLIKPADIDKTFKILEQIGYVTGKDKSIKITLHKRPALVTSFIHSVECVHAVTGTKIDLHWRIGSLCTAKFTDDLWKNPDVYGAIPNARKPQLAYEVFMIIIHAVISGNHDNLNWIIDIALLNPDDYTWQKVRELAIAEKKESLFDYGCAILLDNGVNALKPLKAVAPKVLINTEEITEALPRIRLYSIKLNNFSLHLKYLFPHTNIVGKVYQGLRRIKLFIILKRVDRWLNKTETPFHVTHP